MTHWADVEAATLLEKKPGKQVFATAITPSGPIHVGNMREVLTSEAIFRATSQALGPDHPDAPQFIYIADDYDPLRKVYPFLHPTYEPHVGKPLREIPCPDAEGRPNGCGQHDSYAGHFLEPFLSNLDELGIAPTVLSAYEMYHEGRYAEQIRVCLDKGEAIRAIIEKVSGRQLPKAWAPFNPQCPTCRRINDVRVASVDAPHVSAHCHTCDQPFTVDATTPGAGKLPWRIDWPARWAFLGVTFEASGKDHHASGGSWATGVAIAKEVLEIEPPYGIMYEFLNLKGKGAMHSSSGLAVSAADMLQMTPPEVLRFLLMRTSPRKAIDFDPGLGVLNLVDQFDRFERVHFGADEDTGSFSEIERTYQLSCPHAVPDTLPVKAPYKHLVTVSQMAQSVEDIAAILQRSGELPDGFSMSDLAERVAHVRFWLSRFAPENVRFQVQKDVPDVALDEDDRAFLDALIAGLDGCAWEGQAIHDAVYEAKGERSPGKAFRVLYQAILGQDRGPRAGFFLSGLERDWVLERLRSL